MSIFPMHASILYSLLIVKPPGFGASRHRCVDTIEEIELRERRASYEKTFQNSEKSVGKNLYSIFRLPS